MLGDNMSEGPQDTAAIVHTGSDNSPGVDQGETVIQQSREIKSPELKPQRTAVSNTRRQILAIGKLHIQGNNGRSI